MINSKKIRTASFNDNIDRWRIKWFELHLKKTTTIDTAYYSRGIAVRAERVRLLDLVIIMQCTD